MAITYKQCPKCGSKRSIPILFGKPTYEVALEEKAGKLVLGGCCVQIDDPDYLCKDCHHQWNRSEAIDAAYRKISGLKAAVGGYFDGFYTVFIDFQTRELTWNYVNETTMNKSFNKRMRLSTIDQLLEELQMVDLINWKKNYQEPGVLDGTSWYVEIIREGRNIIKRGNNMFPSEWKMFCKIIQRVSENRFS